MFNSTHTLTGILLARSGLDRWTPHAVVTAAIAANVPDIDIVMGLPGSVDYIQHHRGITHSLIAIPFLSLVLAAALYRWTGNVRRTFLVALLAMLTHPALDYTNSYGIQPLLPFSGTRYYGDTLPLIDPYLDVLLLAGTIATYAMKKRARTLAWATASMMLIYLGARVELRNEAQAQVAAWAATQENAKMAAVLPETVDPRGFSGIVEMPDRYLRIPVQIGRVLPIPSDSDSRALFKAPSDRSDIIRSAATARSAVIFHQFARFPAVKVEETAPGYRVLFLDSRFYTGRSGTSFAAEVLLDRSLHVIADNAGFRTRIP